VQSGCAPRRSTLGRARRRGWRANAADAVNLFRKPMLNFRKASSRVLARLLYRKLRVLDSEGVTGVRLLDGSAHFEGASDTFLGVQEAIAMLRDRSEVHARWLTRCANQIVLVPPMRAPAAFEPITRSVLLGCDVGSRHDSAAIAVFVTHEIAHARMAALGAPSARRNVELRRRIERRCVREQLEAILRIDPEHYLVPWSIDLLQLANESRLTPSKAQLSATAQRTYRRIRAGGYPKWVGRLGVRLALGLRR
jgi:hypothetical protein